MVMAEWRRKRRVQAELARGEPISPRHFGYDPRRSEYSKTLKERGITEQAEVNPETEQVREASEAQGFISIDPRVVSRKEVAENIAENILGNLQLKRALPETMRFVDLNQRVTITKTEEVKNELPATWSSPREPFVKLVSNTTTEKAVTETAAGGFIELKNLVVEPIKGVVTTFRRWQWAALESQGSDISQAPKWVQGVLGQRTNKTSFEPEEKTFLFTGGLIAAGGGALGTPGRKLTELAIKTYPIIKTGEFLNEPSFEKLGSAAAAGVLVYSNIPEKASKVFSLDTLKALEADKSAKVGGRSARERAGGFSKAELRKRSFEAQRNPNVFYDKGEVGVRIRSPELKAEQFTKERVVRFKPEGIVEIKDVQLGNRGRLITRMDESFQGKGSTPGFRKQYPEGYYSQSLNLPSGTQDLVGITMMKQSVKSNIYTKAGKVPEVDFKDVSVKQFSKEPSGSGYLITQRQFPNTNKFQQPNIEIQTGFRPGMKQKLFQRINEQRLLNERVGFISDISQSTDILPKLETNIKMKVGMEELTVKKSLSGSLELPKFESVVLSGFRMDYDVAKASKISSITATKPQERYELKTEQIVSFKPKPVVPPAQPIKFKPTKSFTPEPRETIFPTIDFSDIPKPKPEPKKPKEPPPEEIIKPIDFWFPKMKLKGMKGFSVGKPSKKIFAYEPSIVGIAFKIKQPKMQKNKVFTGLEVRGI
jgi:hypothetical protein